MAMINDFQTDEVSRSEFDTLKARIKRLEDYAGLTLVDTLIADKLNTEAEKDHAKRYLEEFGHE